MSHSLDAFFHLVRSGGVAFVALDRGEVHLAVDGWAERGGKWHLFRDGRTPCSAKYPLTNTRTRLVSAPPHGVAVCAGCRKKEHA